MREHSFHEIQIDYQNAQIDKSQNAFIRRGSFKDVEDEIPSLARQGISSLYLMGTLERDNYPFLNKYSDQIEFRKDDASPLATIDRCRVNQMLGGDEGLAGVMR